MIDEPAVKRLLVTGSHGFVGNTVARMVAADPLLLNWQVIDTPEQLDLRDSTATTAMVGAAAPDAVLHLAAQSWVPDAFRDPATTLSINLFGTLNLLQALKQTAFDGRMIYVGTGDVYGRVPEDELPVGETRLPEPRNPYSVSKLAAEALCRQWAATEGMDIVLARPFNHIGWGQSDRFVVSDFARQIVAAKKGSSKPVIMVGDIDVTRDFTDVRDVVHAYFALFNAGASGEIYNVCSARETSIADVLDRLANLYDVKITTVRDPARFRKAEQRRICGNAAKIERTTGWRATTPLDESLSAMLRYWETEGIECQNRH